MDAGSEIKNFTAVSHVEAHDEILTVLVGFRPENYQGDRGKVRDKRWKAQLGAWFRGEGWFVREVREALLIAPRRRSTS